MNASPHGRDGRDRGVSLPDDIDVPSDRMCAMMSETDTDGDERTENEGFPEKVLLAYQVGFPPAPVHLTEPGAVNRLEENPISAVAGFCGDERRVDTVCDLGHATTIGHENPDRDGVATLDDILGHERVCETCADEVPEDIEPDWTVNWEVELAHRDA